MRMRVGLRKVYRGTVRFVRAGPLTTRPERSKRAAWRGQTHASPVAQASSAPLDLSRQPMCVQIPTTTSHLSCPSFARFASSASASFGNTSFRANRSGSSDASAARHPNRLRHAMRDHDGQAAPLNPRLTRLDWSEIDIFHIWGRRSFVWVHLIDERPDLTSPPPKGVFYNRMSASSHTRGHRYAPSTPPLCWHGSRDTGASS